jgi:hypothetical protein
MNELRKEVASEASRSFKQGNTTKWAALRNIRDAIDEDLVSADHPDAAVSQKLVDANQATADYHAVWGKGTLGEKLLGKQAGDAAIRSMAGSSKAKIESLAQGLDPEGRVAFSNSFIDQPISPKGTQATDPFKMLDYYRNNETLGRAVMGDANYEKLLDNTKALITKRSSLEAAQAAAKAPIPAATPPRALPGPGDLATLRPAQWATPLGAMGMIARIPHAPAAAAASIGTPVAEWLLRATHPGLLQGGGFGLIGAAPRQALIGEGQP